MRPVIIATNPDDNGDYTFDEKFKPKVSDLFEMKRIKSIHTIYLTVKQAEHLYKSAEFNAYTRYL